MTALRSAPKSGVDAAEREARIELAACYRIFDHLGWTEAIYNHITVRLAGPERHFLINPFGLMYREVCASNLVKIDTDGNVVGHVDGKVNPAGFIIHSAIHAAREDAHCVMHTHTTAGLAVACKAQGLSMDNFYSAQLHDLVAYHDFEGITVHDDEKPRLLASMGDKPILILRNHGLLTVGATVPAAFARLYTLQRACEVQFAAQSMAGADIPIPADVSARATRDALQFDPRYGAGADIFAAFQRRIDRADPSYRD